MSLCIYQKLSFSTHTSLKHYFNIYIYIYKNSSSGDIWKKKERKNYTRIYYFKKRKKYYLLSYHFIFRIDACILCESSLFQPFSCSPTTCCYISWEFPGSSIIQLLPILVDTSSGYTYTAMKVFVVSFKVNFIYL
jgi:hypothetical protein